MWIDPRDPVTTSVAASVKIYDTNRKKFITTKSAEASYGGEVYSVKGNAGRKIIDFIGIPNVFPLVAYVTAGSHSQYGMRSSETRSLCAHRVFDAPGQHFVGYKDFSTIKAINNDDYIDVIVHSIPASVGCARILREDLSMPVNDPNRTIEIGHQYFPPQDGFSLKDYQCVRNRTYRYFATYSMTRSSLIFGGSEIDNFVSKNDDIIKRVVETEPIPFKINISEPFLSSTSTSLKVSFLLSANITASGFSKVAKMVSNAGLDGIYADELTKNKDDLHGMVAFIVERVRLDDDGMKEKLGIAIPGTATEPGTFVDHGKGGILHAEGSYTYFFHMCLVQPSSLFKKIKKSLTAEGQDSGDEETEIDLVKFTRQVTKQTGVIMTPADKDMSPESIIEDSRTGLTLTRDLFHEKSLGSPHDLVITPKQSPMSALGKISGIIAMLTWRIGDRKPNNLSPGKVDSFLVYCVYGGKESLIGTVDSVGNKTKYSFVDNNYVNQVGHKKYYVIALMNDMTTSMPSNSVSIFKAHSGDIMPGDGAKIVGKFGNSSLIAPNEPKTSLM